MVAVINMIERFHVAVPDTSTALWIHADDRPTITKWVMLAHIKHVGNLQTFTKITLAVTRP